MAGETPTSGPPAAEGGAPLDGAGGSLSSESPGPAPSGSTGGVSPRTADRVAEPSDAGVRNFRAREKVSADDYNLKNALLTHIGGPAAGPGQTGGCSGNPEAGASVAEGSGAVSSIPGSWNVIPDTTSISTGSAQTLSGGPGEPGPSVSGGPSTHEPREAMESTKSTASEMAATPASRVASVVVEAPPQAEPSPVAPQTGSLSAMLTPTGEGGGPCDPGVIPEVGPRTGNVAPAGDGVVTPPEGKRAKSPRGLPISRRLGSPDADGGDRVHDTCMWPSCMSAPACPPHQEPPQSTGTVCPKDRTPCGFQQRLRAPICTLGRATGGQTRTSVARCVTYSYSTLR